MLGLKKKDTGRHRHRGKRRRRSSSSSSRSSERSISPRDFRSGRSASSKVEDRLDAHPGLAVKSALKEMQKYLVTQQGGSSLRGKDGSDLSPMVEAVTLFFLAATFS